MKTKLTTAQLVGCLFLFQLAGGIFLNFFMLKPIFTGTNNSGFEISTIMGLATLLAIALSSINLITTLLCHKNFSRTQSKHFLLTIAFATIGIAFTAVEYTRTAEFSAIVSYMSESAISSSEVTAQLARKMLAEGRNSAHFMAIILSSFSLLLFYGLVYRSQIIPRTFSSFALFACLLQLVAVGHTLFNQAIPMILQLPLFITQLVIPLYLIIAGFKLNENEPPLQAALER